MSSSRSRRIAQVPAGRPPRRIQLLVLRGCTPLVPVGVFDLLRKSLELAASMPGATARLALDVALVATGGRSRVRCAGGLELQCHATSDRVRPGDLVVVPALDPEVIARIDDNREAIPFLRRATAAGADVASACTGAFLLAEAGLLDGRTATTHWAFQDLFRQRYPRVRLAPQAVVVDNGGLITAGGATSFLHLAMLLVERLLGAEVGRAASRLFLIDTNKAPQGAYAMFATQREHHDEAIARAQHLIEEKLAEAPSVEWLARATALGLRTFVRRFRRATGNTPREYIQRVRIEAAKRELEAARLSVTEVAASIGYGDPVAFRRLFCRITGLTPADYRSRYGPRGQPAWVRPSGRRGPSVAPKTHKR